MMIICRSSEELEVGTASFVKLFLSFFFLFDSKNCLSSNFITDFLAFVIVYLHLNAKISNKSNCKNSKIIRIHSYNLRNSKQPQINEREAPLKGNLRRFCISKIAPIKSVITLLVHHTNASCESIFNTQVGYLIN